MDINNIMEVNNSNNVKCKICNKFILKKNIKQHSLSKTHKTRAGIIKLCYSFKAINYIISSIDLVDPHFLLYFDKLEKEINTHILELNI